MKTYLAGTGCGRIEEPNAKWIGYDYNPREAFVEGWQEGFGYARRTHAEASMRACLGVFAFVAALGAWFEHDKDLCAELGRGPKRGSSLSKHWGSYVWEKRHP